MGNGPLGLTGMVIHMVARILTKPRCDGIKLTEYVRNVQKEGVAV